MRLLALLVFLFGCTNDPFDPPIGPRNPRPGAEQYLLTRNDVPQDQKKALLNFKPCSLDVLMALSDAPSREVRALVAANPSTSLSIFKKLINDTEPAVRQYIAGNPKTPHAILVQLKNDPDKTVQWGLPRNPNWSADEIRQMYDEKATSPMIFASNPGTPIDILEELSLSNDYNVRTSLANNPSINKSIVRRLVQDQRPSVRIMLTYNEATSLETLKDLTQDPDQNVKRYAVDWLNRRSKEKTE
jgi:uncharacterized protein (UPF0147 family)